MSTFTKITKILKQSLKTQKSSSTQLRNKLAFNIIHVVPNFANILTTVKIVKNSCRQKRSLFLNLNLQKQTFKSLTKYLLPDKSIKGHLEISASISLHWHWYRHRHSNINIAYYTIEIVFRAKNQFYIILNKSSSVKLLPPV